MSTIEPTPLHDCPPYSVMVGVGGELVTIPVQIDSPMIVPRVVPSETDALVELLRAFPATEILETS